MSLFPATSSSMKIDTKTETFTIAGNGYLYFPTGVHIISASLNGAHPVLVLAGTTNDLGLGYVNASTMANTKFTANQSVSITYTYIET